jgi:hypothetical protein
VGTAVEEQGKDDVQRWTTKRKAALVLSIVKGETSIQEAARQHGLTVAEIEDWKERFFWVPRMPCEPSQRTMRRCARNKSRS